MLSFKDDGITDSLHAVFNKILIVVSVFTEVKVSGVDLGDNVLDVKPLSELF